jgi:hypothetical protein
MLTDDSNKLFYTMLKKENLIKQEVAGMGLSFSDFSLVFSLFLP